MLSDDSFCYTFLSYPTLMVKATMLSILNTIRNIFMRIYGSVDEDMTVCFVYPGFGFFVKIYLLDS